MRRVVCGVRDGRSVVLADGIAPTEHGFKALPGHVSAIMWATEADPSPGQEAEAAPIGIQAVPGPGETRLLMVHFPPASVMFGDGFDPVEADREQLEHLPGLAELFEADCPGMHRTQSIDYDIVVKGRIWLELDDGAEVELQAGDVAVQQGNRHAWRNKSDAPATIAFVLVGTAKP